MVSQPYYADESVTLYHGDCLDVLRTLPDASVDLILTDLPYGMTDCDWDSQIDLDVLWPLFRHSLKANGAVALTASQPFTSTLVASNPAQFKHEWIWEKNAGSNFGTVKRQPMKEHESVLIFSWGRYHYAPIMQERATSGLARVKSGAVNYATKAEAYGSGGLTGTASSVRPDLRYPRSIQRFNRERGLHPTQKPVALMRCESVGRASPRPRATLLGHVCGVLSGRAKPEVRWVAARRVVAGVEHPEPVRDWTMSEYPSGPVCIHMLAVEASRNVGRAFVAQGHVVATPRPAPIRSGALVCSTPEGHRSRLGRVVGQVSEVAAPIVLGRDARRLVALAQE